MAPGRDTGQMPPVKADPTVPGRSACRQEEAESVPDSLQRKRRARKEIRQEDWFVSIPSLGLSLQATKHI